MIGLDALLNVGGKLIDKLIPDPEAKVKAQLELQKMVQDGELAKMANETKLFEVEQENVTRRVEADMASDINEWAKKYHPHKILFDKYATQTLATKLEQSGWRIEDCSGQAFYQACSDLSVGHEGESLVNQLLTNGKTIEVKYDEKAYYWASRRGTPNDPNLYIEYRNSTKNEDSGIMTSRSDFYVYIIKDVENVAYIFRTAKLLEHLMNANYKSVGNSATGDDNAEGWIPPLSMLTRTKSFIKRIVL